MNITQEQVIEQSMALARMSAENYTFRDMIVEANAIIKKLTEENAALKEADKED